MKLTKEVVAIEVLRQTGQTKQDIAARLGITEGAVRYHLRRQADKSRDGRSKTSLIEELRLVEVVNQWYADQLASMPQGRPPNLNLLWSYLVDQYAYSGLYKSVRKFVRERYPAPIKRPFRRIETPPAAQVQSNWLETQVRLLDHAGFVAMVKLYGFVMTLSHSRKTAVIWSERMNQIAWHHVHKDCTIRFEGRTYSVPYRFANKSIEVHGCKRSAILTLLINRRCRVVRLKPCRRVNGSEVARGC